ncbi:MAG: 16S rRNA (cytidine(1402)-2'-O)-methyltransferase [Dehalococcoidales bacterium]|nr:16S rRNA (cytidine(1402)-2'-O)-methyltransferase [Dehalococcoidales bacterium]
MPVLYLVATPIGNLEDISLRALRTLREVNLIAAEDTRRTKQLLTKYDIKTSLTSYHEHNKKAKLDYLLERLGSEDVALVSDAGMPGMSDPGYELVVAASERGVPVVPVPGPSAVITALAVSGLPVQRFIYLGFLPRRASSRVKLLESVAGECGSIVVLETPHRLRASLNDIRLALGDRRIAACRELTKVYEEVFRGTISEAIEHFTQPKGEFTLVIAGRDEEDKPQLTTEIEEQLSGMRQSGIRAREAITRTASETGLSRKELYRAWLKLP